MGRMRGTLGSLLAAISLLPACGGGGSTPAAAGTTVVFDLGADPTNPDHFYDVPYPSDLRLTAQGTPDLTGLPYPTFLSNISALQKNAMQHPGFPVVPVAYFLFDAPPAAQDASQVIAADKASPVLL